MEGVPGKLKIAYFVTLKACLLYDCKTVIGIPLKTNPCGASWLMAVALDGWDAEWEVAGGGRPSSPGKYHVSGGWNPSLLYLHRWFPGCVTDAAFSLRQKWLSKLHRTPPPRLYKTKNPPLPISRRVVSLINKKKTELLDAARSLERLTIVTRLEKKAWSFPFLSGFLRRRVEGRRTKTRQCVCGDPDMCLPLRATRL